MILGSWTPWASGRPDDNFENQGCVGLNSSGQMDDQSCSGHGSGFICEPHRSAELCVDGDGDGHGLNCPDGPDCDDLDSAVHTRLIGYADVDDDDRTTGFRSLCTSGTLPASYRASASNVPDCDDDDPAVFECDVQERLHRGATYFFHSGEPPQDFAAAQSACTQQHGAGAHLVEVNDAEEDLFIRAEVRHLFNDGKVWLGAQKIDDEPTFAWASTGMPPEYEGFRGNQPNAVADCIVHTQHGWESAFCNFGRSFVCEVP